MELPEIAAFDSLEQKLRSYDWQADLKLNERSVPWLARKTGRSERTVYGYKYGEIKPPLQWLRDAYRVLNGG